MVQINNRVHSLSSLSVGMRDPNQLMPKHHQVTMNPSIAASRIAGASPVGSLLHAVLVLLQIFLFNLRSELASCPSQRSNGDRWLCWARQIHICKICIDLPTFVYTSLDNQTCQHHPAGYFYHIRVDFRRGTVRISKLEDGANSRSCIATAHV